MPPRGSSRATSRRGGAAKKDDEEGTTATAETGGAPGDGVNIASIRGAGISGTGVSTSSANNTNININRNVNTNVNDNAFDTATTTTTTSNRKASTTSSSTFTDEESLVFAYLHKHGLSHAASELQSILKRKELEQLEEEDDIEGGGSEVDGKKRVRNEGENDGDARNQGAGKEAKKSKPTSTLPPIDYDVEEEEDSADEMEENGNVNKDEEGGGTPTAGAAPGGAAAAVAAVGKASNSSGDQVTGSTTATSNNNTLLASATGGGFGYDLDAAPTVALWGASASCNAPPLSKSYLPPVQIRDAFAREMLSLQRQGGEGGGLLRRPRRREMDGGGDGDVDGNGVDDNKEEDGDANMTDTSGGETDIEKTTTKENVEEGDEEEIEATLFRDEARRYIEGYTSLMTWILTLPDDPANPIVTALPVFDDATAENPTRMGNNYSNVGGVGSEDKGEKVTNAGGVDQNPTTAAAMSITRDDNDKMDVDNDSETNLQNRTTDVTTKSSSHIPHEGLATLVKHSLVEAGYYGTTTTKIPTSNLTLPLGASLAIPSASSFHYDPLLLPPSVKPELLALSFPLLVHTYCELLAVGLEHTLLAFLDTYRHLYEATYPNELSDLDHCRSTQCIVELNNDVIARSVLLSEMRVLSSQFPLVKRKLSEIEREYEQVKSKTARSDKEEKLLQYHDRRVAKYNNTLSWTHDKFIDLSSRNEALSKKLLALPFLRRVRAFKWNITISTASFEALTSFVSSRDDLLPMSALLQSRCHLIVERRDPLPFCPPAVLDDIMDVNKKDGKKDNSVRWAAPIHPVARAIEAGEDLAANGVTGSEPPHRLPRSILTHSEALPYPKIRLEDGDDTNDGEARAAVEFNRALLINGFRRLEALELKQEYEAGMLPCSGPTRQVHIADALKPSILLATICSSSSATQSEADVGAGPAADTTWIEPNIGVTSASICPPDGRRVALGCDDAAVRIWSLDRSTKNDKSPNQNDPSGASSMGEPFIVLLGHKNGFPVFDVDWTRNGRTLLSAGGDGTVRLWDTQAVGPYGELSNVTVHQKGDSTHTVGGPTSTSLSTVIVPGSKAESLVKVGGAALSVYRGHAPSTPVWGVASAPCGYYFASAGSDYTARIWATDRTSPVRVLSGHVSPSVNCVAWHPNCNYVITASDDKTCRMFDIQTGRCVRLLSGSTRGLNLVRISPSGRYAAGAGYDGVVRIWDLGNGRMVNQLRHENASSSPSSYSEGLIHAMSFSSCGAALAVTGSDCTVRIWDVRGAGNHLSNPDYFAASRGPTATSSFSNGLSSAASKPQMERMPGSERSRPGTRVPAKLFKTNNVSILDLKYTKRNLLLAVGNY